MAAYIDLYIVIMERDGYDLTALYRHIHSITGVFKREFLWRHKQERDLREPFASINAVFPRRSAWETEALQTLSVACVRYQPHHKSAAPQLAIQCRL